MISSAKVDIKDELPDIKVKRRKDKRKRLKTKVKVENELFDKFDIENKGKSKPTEIKGKLDIQNQKKEKVYNRICAECGHSTFTRNQYNHHMAYRHPKFMYICKTCGKVFLNIEKFKIHYNVHRNIKPFKCLLC